MANPIVDYILGFKAAEWRTASNDTLSATVDGDVPVALYRQGSAKRLIVGSPNIVQPDYLDICGEPGAAAGDALAELWAHAEEQVRPKPEQAPVYKEPIGEVIGRICIGRTKWQDDGPLLRKLLAEERAEAAERIAALEADLAVAEERAMTAERDLLKFIEVDQFLVKRRLKSELDAIRRRRGLP